MSALGIPSLQEVDGSNKGNGNDKVCSGIGNSGGVSVGGVLDSGTRINVDGVADLIKTIDARVRGSIIGGGDGSGVNIDYIPGPEYPEYLPPADDVFPAEEQPLPTAVSPTAKSPGYITNSEPEMDPEEEDGDDEKSEGDSIDYLTSRGDDDADDDDDLSEDDADDEDEEESSDSKEEEEEHL
nr:hypothetical protein [Tanacetum cinerariifolium]